MKIKSQESITFDRILTLLTLTVASAAFYGPRILILCGTAAAVSMLTELISLYLRGISYSLRHLDAAASGLMLALMCPPTIPFSVLIIACIFAIIIGRQFFGGSENPIFPPAAVGYLFLRLSRIDNLLKFPKICGFLPIDCAQISLSSGTSEVWNQSGKIGGSLGDWLTCISGTAIGSASFVMLATVGIVMILRRSTAPTAALTMIASVILLNLAAVPPEMYVGTSIYCMMSNLTLFSAIYLIGNAELAPSSAVGGIFGLFAGIFTFYLTRVLHITDAPVLLAVLMQPLGMWLKKLWASAMKAAERMSKNAGNA